MKTHATYLGIDISKTTLHLVTSEKFVKEFGNTATGHRQLIERILKLETPRVVLEASGGYERRVCEALQDAVPLPAKLRKWPPAWRLDGAWSSASSTIDSGKTESRSKVAIIACARKLIVRLNTLLKQFHTPENSPNATIST